MWMLTDAEGAIFIAVIAVAVAGDAAAVMMARCAPHR
jgi:hypothetical protein